jgi:hypothetical protein
MAVASITLLRKHRAKRFIRGRPHQYRSGGNCGGVD